MNQTLLTLSMIAASGLLAQNDAPMPSQTHQQTTHDSCHPCCSNPRPCVDGIGYVPPFYHLPCTWGWSFNAAFLYWYARETNLSYAAKVTALPIIETVRENVLLGTDSYKQLDPSWAPGFRIGIGFNSSSDGWDYNLVWTWYRTTQSESTSVSDFTFAPFSGQNFPLIPGANQSALLNPWINAGIHYLTANLANTFNQVSANYFDTITACA